MEGNLPPLREKVELKGSVISVTEDNIVIIEIRSDIYFEENDAIEIARTLKSICGAKKFPTIIRLGKYTNMDKDAREYLASEDRSQFSAADAIVATDYPGKLVANFYINFHKPVRPTVVFDSEEAAIEWLQNFKGVDLKI